ncbi:hydrogenase maturation protein [Amphritea sp. HPY]|uniref:hydrogenase maturation protein n=1 Tax=Amphritea sp. HPY TaxID=3421652 RepID=UPI003D7C9CB4
MKILFLTHSFNSLSQRLYVELQRRGHDVSVEFDINDAVAEEAVELFQPQLIVAPFLKRAIPESIWRKHRCIIVHPGIEGDRGPSSVDWAIMRDENCWGVTCLQADAEMDAGDIWATVEFDMRAASKSSLYRNEITESAVSGILKTVALIEAGGYQPQALNYDNPEIRGQWHCLMQQADRAIDWSQHSSVEVLARIRAADSVPGVKTEIAGRQYFLYNGMLEGELNSDLRADPGSIIATRDRAICIATIDGAIWVTHLRPADPVGDEFSFKLPATFFLKSQLEAAPIDLRVPDLPLAVADQPQFQTWQEIHYREANAVGYLSFDFYNGAMDSEQCQRLQQAVKDAKQRGIKVLVLMGGAEFWSNGIHLNQIEAAASPADESWRNINAMNDLCLEIIDSPKQLTMVAMRGNAGAGGVFMALAADKVSARHSVILNPHYRSMGNLYGSEYWTYLLPKRVGEEQARLLMQNRLPIGAEEACESGLIDSCFMGNTEAYLADIVKQAELQAAAPDFLQQLALRNARLASDQAEKSLQQYRDEELKQMKLNFYGFDPSYHVARYHFVEKLPKARTPSWLACHRKL